MAKLKIVPEGFDATNMGVLNGPTSLEDQSGMRFGSAQAEGYIQELLVKLEADMPLELQQKLVYVANQAKWAVGWKDFGRLVLEVMG